MIKALPNKISELNFPVVEMFDFNVFQEALQAFQNTNTVNAFEYFDDKNRERIENMKFKMQ